MRVVVFGTYDVRMHPRVGVLAEGLRALGDDVVECNVPLGLTTAQRVAMLRQPWRIGLLVWRLLRSWTLLAIRARRVGPVDAVLVGYLGHFDVHLARLLFRGAPVALDFLIFASDTARDRGETGSLKGRVMTAIDAAALRSSDVVVVDTEEHLERIPERHRHKGVVALVGAPAAWFVDRPERAPDDRLRVVFFGLFTPLQGTPTVAAAVREAQHRTPVRALLVGRGQDLEAARSAAGPADIEWLEWVEPEDLPALVARYDVCLGVFGTGAKALRVVPNKVYQGAAAGCAIVTSDTEPQRRVLGDAAVLVPPGDAGALAEAIVTLAHDRAELRRRQQAVSDLARTAFAGEAVVAPLRKRLQQIPR